MQMKLSLILPKKNPYKKKENMKIFQVGGPFLTVYESNFK